MNHAASPGRPILIIPGWGDSGPGHWQTLWEAAWPTARRVTQRDWDRPAQADWVATLDHAIADCAEPPILAAHSLGCLAVIHWAATHRRPVAGALLAAPVDSERKEFPPTITGFAPVPTGPLPFPSVVAASVNDPFMQHIRARALADAWGSRFVDAGRSGHINTASGFGPWPEGEALLRELIAGTGAPG
ncbi:MAG TPA: alpha/beta hydrolase [Nitrospiria bacterium]|nr:alpha/beta hydrolase [Nitrospiria bacterium]